MRESNSVPGVRGSPSTSTSECPPLRSANEPNCNGRRTFSACHVSAASISAEACAATMSTPLPLNTALDRALGRQTIATGMPVRSKPVRFAIRVMPNAAANVLTRATVSSGGTLRRVSGQYVTPTSLFREFVLRSSSKRILSQRRSIVIHFSPGIFEDSWAAIGLLRRSAPRNDGSVRQFPVGNDGAPPSNLVLRMRRSNAANSVRAPPIAIGRPAKSTAKVINSTIAAEYARSGLRPQMQPPRRP